MDTDETKALDLDTRKRIYEHISATPGTHFREIERRLGLPVGVVAYHLKYFEDKEMIVSKKEGKYKRYYIVGKLGSRDKALMSLLRQEIPRQILMYVIMNPGTTHKQVMKLFSISPSTLSFHIKKLIDAQALEAEKDGRTRRYYIMDEERVAKALINYKKGFESDVVDSFTKAWMDIHL